VKIISGVEGARDPDVSDLFQVIFFNTGVIKYIKANEIKRIVND